jgi:hypothetical protein
MCFVKEGSRERRAVSTVEDAGKLIENGFEYVTDMDGLKLFRKPK